MKEKRTYKNSWCEFTPTWSGFNLSYDLTGYYDSKPILQIYFIWGKLFLHLPWRHYRKVEREKTLKEKRKDKLDTIAGKKTVEKVYKKVLYDEGCDSKSYGIYFFQNQFCIKYGRKVKMYDMPWVYDWVRTSCLRKDGEWENETKNDRNKNFWDKDKWKDILFYETYPYLYITYNNEEQHSLATIRVEEREWRWKWFKWLKYTRKTYKCIDVSFKVEIGEGKNSYKGGVTGCSYEMLPNETPFQTLKRMEQEKRFR